jgi:hypothetical protein
MKAADHAGQPPRRPAALHAVRRPAASGRCGMTQDPGIRRCLPDPAYRSLAGCGDGRVCPFVDFASGGGTHATSARNDTRRGAVRSARSVTAEQRRRRAGRRQAPDARSRTAVRGFRAPRRRRWSPPVEVGGLSTSGGFAPTFTRFRAACAGAPAGVVHSLPLVRAVYEIASCLTRNRDHITTRKRRQHGPVDNMNDACLSCWSSSSCCWWTGAHARRPPFLLWSITGLRLMSWRDLDYFGPTS